MTPRVAASERGRAQTARVAARAGLQGGRHGRHYGSGSGLERPAGEGDSPVCETGPNLVRTLSRAGPEEPCPNPAAPSAKAKHSRETDSVQVP